VYNAPLTVINRPTGGPKLRFKDPLKHDMTCFNISPVASNHDNWRTALSPGIADIGRTGHDDDFIRWMPAPDTGQSPTICCLDGDLSHSGRIEKKNFKSALALFISEYKR